MIKYTQTNLSPGNCWQTCIASILEVDPLHLPDQATIDANGKHASADYTNALGSYLRKHHGLIYIQIPCWHVAGSLNLSGYHLIIGETVRTPENNRRHVVVGLDGKWCWDPHPSRKFLTKMLSYGILVPRLNIPGIEDLYADECICPRCKAV